MSSSAAAEIAPLRTDIDPGRIVDFDYIADDRLTPDIHEGVLRLRDEAPDLFWTPHHGGHWVVMDPALITEVLRTPGVYSSRNLTIPPNPLQPKMIPESLDPPEHHHYRQLMMKYFEPHSIKRLTGSIEQWTNKILDEAVAKGEGDFVAEIASRLPVSVLMEFVGFPLDRFHDFRAMVEKLFSAETDEERIPASMDILMEVMALIAARRESPQDDLISELIAVDFQDRKLNDEELTSILYLLFLAGLDTVTNAMTFGMAYLARHPDLQDRVAADPDLVPKLVDELMRRHTFPNLPRQVTQDTELAGVSLKEGEMILCVLAMVGLDDTLNPDAQTVDLERQGGKHFGFGSGAHTCLGRHLGKLELEIFYRHWLERVARVEIDTTKPVGRNRGGPVMGMPNLWLNWTVR